MIGALGVSLWFLRVQSGVYWSWCVFHCRELCVMFLWAGRWRGGSCLCELLFRKLEVSRWQALGHFQRGQTSLFNSNWSVHPPIKLLSQVRTEPPSMRNLWLWVLMRSSSWQWGPPHSMFPLCRDMFALKNWRSHLSCCVCVCESVCVWERETGASADVTKAGLSSHSYWKHTYYPAALHYMNCVCVCVGGRGG